MKSRPFVAIILTHMLIVGMFFARTADTQVACGFSLGSGIYAKWVATGGEKGFLGCPTGNEADAARSPKGTTGRYADFGRGDGGTILWHGSGPFQGRSFEVHGCIFKVYKSAGGSASWLGFPVFDEVDVAGGRRSDFEGGSVVWDARTGQCRAARGDDGSGGSGGFCASVEGTWQWFTGATVVIRSGGKIEGKDDQGSWEVIDPGQRRFRLRWDSGYIDDLQLSADGRRMEGTNQHGTPVSGTRECQTGGSGGGGIGGGGGRNSDDCARIEGTWQWFNGKTIAIRSGGQLDAGDDRGTWVLVDPGQKSYQLRWGEGWVDDLKLSADGKRLDGTNQTGAQVSGTRECRGGGGGGGSGGGGGGGICANPRTLEITDRWLSLAKPPQKPGESLRYESWGRLVGRSLTATLTTSGAPDTRLSRCEYLWSHAAGLHSTNGLGTLKEYVEQSM